MARKLTFLLILNLTALALACPGVDYIKLWPLPVEGPWQSTPNPLPDPADPFLVRNS
jgi:hypothetical protein